MKKSVFLFLLATITSASNRTRRFTSLDSCDINVHPSLVCLTKRYNESGTAKYRFGAGNIITMKWIVTHSIIFLSNDYSNWKVVAGSNHQIPNETDEFSTIKNTVMGPLYGFDIMLCELEKPLVQSDRIQPANLPKNSFYVSHYNVFTVVGWGINVASHEMDTAKERERMGGNLRCADVNKVDCISSLDARLCFNVAAPRSRLCRTDTGLGVFYNDTLIGITIGLDNNVRGDCSRVFMIAADIFQYISWLHETTGTGMTSKQDHPTTVTTSVPYQPSTKPAKRSTTDTYKRRFSSLATTEEQLELSHCLRIEPNHCILLLICLVMIL